MKKILVLGAPGSGKTYFSKQLSKKLELSVYHLDFYYYKANWEAVSSEEFACKQREILQNESWIIDGNSVRMLSERLERADTVIFLDIPLWQRILRILWRDCIPFKRNKNLPTDCTFSIVRFIAFFREHVVTFDKNKKQKILDTIVKHPKVNFFHIRSAEQSRNMLKSL